MKRIFLFTLLGMALFVPTSGAEAQVGSPHCQTPDYSLFADCVLDQVRSGSYPRLLWPPVVLPAIAVAVRLYREYME